MGGAHASLLLLCVMEGQRESGTHTSVAMAHSTPMNTEVMTVDKLPTGVPYHLLFLRLRGG